MIEDTRLGKLELMGFNLFNRPLSNSTDLSEVDPDVLAQQATSLFTQAASEQSRMVTLEVEKYMLGMLDVNDQQLNLNFKRSNFKIKIYEHGERIE